MLLKRVVFLLLQFYIVHGLNDTKRLLNVLLSDYQKYARPVHDENDTLSVTVGLYFKSIQEFDEVQERFSYTAGLSIIWKDVGMVWEPSQYGGVKAVSVSWDDLWTPQLILINPSKEITSLGQKWQMVRYFNTGVAIWTPGLLLETNCPVNARNYPFDTQVCTTTFQLIGVPKTEMVIQSAKPGVDVSRYVPNSAWTLLKTHSETNFSIEIGQIEFTFYLKRKSGFVIINIFLPILFLNILNVLVFVLVPESGDRVSFCITVLLAIAVFMTIVSDTLPKSSEPVPIISYKLMIDMIVSSLITVITITNIGIYNKPETEEKPEWIVRLYRSLYCKNVAKGENERPIKSDGVASGVSADKPEHMRTTQTLVPEERDMDKAGQIDELDTDHVSCRCVSMVTWKDISRMVDRISLVFFMLAVVSSLVIFILMTAVTPV